MKHYEAGDGDTTLVFLHGGNVAGWMWGEQLPAFTDYHVLVPDFPGFGTSNDEPWVSVAATADRVAELITSRARGSRAVVVGLSLGSSVAIELALRHPDAATALFLASPTVTPPGRWQQLLGRTMLRFWERPAFWHALARGYGLPADSVELFVSTGLGIRRATAEAIFAEVTAGIPADRLAQLDLPVLAVAGGADSPAVQRDSLAALSAAGATTAIAPGMHHQWNIENVELFNQSLRAWLDRREVAAGLSASI
jgi:pimeloyl-ACP methyl ester carboxylesterase